MSSLVSALHFSNRLAQEKRAEKWDKEGKRLPVRLAEVKEQTVWRSAAFPVPHVASPLQVRFPARHNTQPFILLQCDVAFLLLPTGGP